VERAIVTELREMPNIGAVVAAELEASGIADGEALMAAGSVGAAIRLRDSGYDVCKSKLGGLEGAIRGIKWHSIPSEERAALWTEFQELMEG
jgi:DNA transformation protein and related proteins